MLEYVLLLTFALVVILAAIASPTGAVNVGLTQFFNGIGAKMRLILVGFGG